MKREAEPGSAQRLDAVSSALKTRCALLHKRHRALDEVVAASHFLLNPGLQLELLLHPAVQPVVELALAARVGARRAGRHLARQRADLSEQLLAWHDAVD